VGFYHLSALGEERIWNSFFQANLNQPILIQNDYLPGHELAVAYGIYHSAFRVTGGLKWLPMLQLRSTLKAADQGVNGDSSNTGYQRLFAAPAIEVTFGDFRLYTELSLPFYQYFNGNQLASTSMFKGLMAYSF
jgi:hypothetical protein